MDQPKSSPSKKSSAKKASTKKVSAKSPPAPRTRQRTSAAKRVSSTETTAKKNATKKVQAKATTPRPTQSQRTKPSDPPSPPSWEAIEQILSRNPAETPPTSSPTKSNPPSENDSEPFTMLGFLIGGGLGIWGAIQTLSDDSYVGARHTPFYAAVLFAGVGALIGSGVDRLIKNSRKN